jgi:hypothetical protein
MATFEKAWYALKSGKQVKPPGCPRWFTLQECGKTKTKMVARYYDDPMIGGIYLWHPTQFDLFSDEWEIKERHEA